MKKYVLITCLVGLPGFINLMLCGVIAFDYWLIPNPQDSMMHRALIGVVNEPLVAIGNTCSLLFFFMIVPILFLVSRNGAKIEELEKERQAYHDAGLELKGLKEKYLKLIEAPIVMAPGAGKRLPPVGEKIIPSGAYIVKERTYYQIRDRNSLHGKNGVYSFDTVQEARDIALEFKANPRSVNESMPDNLVEFYKRQTLVIEGKKEITYALESI